MASPLVVRDRKVSSIIEEQMVRVQCFQRNYVSRLANADANWEQSKLGTYTRTYRMVYNSRYK